MTRGSLSASKKWFMGGVSARKSFEVNGQGGYFYEIMREERRVEEIQRDLFRGRRKWSKD